MHCTREPTGNRDYRGNQEPALQLIVQEVAAQVSSLNLSGQEVSVCLVGLDIAILCSGGCSFLVSRRLQLPRLEVSAPWVGVCRSQFRGLKLKAKMFELLVKKLCLAVVARYWKPFGSLGEEPGTRYLQIWVTQNTQCKYIENCPKVKSRKVMC